MQSIEVDSCSANKVCKAKDGPQKQSDILLSIFLPFSSLFAVYFATQNVSKIDSKIDSKKGGKREENRPQTLKTNK